MSAVDCPECRGYGEVWTGRYEHDTHAPITVLCRACNGLGTKEDR